MTKSENREKSSFHREVARDLRGGRKGRAWVKRTLNKSLRRRTKKDVEYVGYVFTDTWCY
jgi:hypothetical protein